MEVSPRKIHVDDDGKVEYCLADHDCRFGSFDSISEAFENYSKRDKDLQKVAHPKSFRYSYPRFTPTDMFRNLEPSPTLLAWCEAAGLTLKSISEYGAEFVKDYNGARLHVAPYRSVSANERVSEREINKALKMSKWRLRKMSASFIDNTTASIVKTHQDAVRVHHAGYIKMKSVLSEASSNFENKMDSNWDDLYLNEATTIKVALEHAEKRLVDVRMSERFPYLTIKDSTVLSFMDLCAEIIHRTDILAEQTLKIFGSNDDKVLSGLLREAIRH